MDLNKYFELTGKNIDSIRNEYRKNAINQIKKDIFLDTVIKIENISINDEDIDKEIDKIARMYKQNKNNLEIYFKKGNNLKMLKKGILREKAIDFLIANSNIKDE